MSVSSPAASESAASSVTAVSAPGGRRTGGLLVLGVVTVLPAVIAVAQLGRIHPDEVYQLLEPAWFRAHGYGVLSWEWRTGLRNWALPGLAAGLLRLAEVLGLTHPVAYRALLALPQAVLHGWMLWATYRFAARRVGSAGGVFSVLLVGLCGPVLVFAGRTLGESLSTSFLVVALEALERPERPARSGLLGGGALGLAVVARYGSAVVVLAALVWLAVARRGRVLVFALLGGAVVAGALGVLDTVTWGQPFHSLRAYVDFNVLSGEAARQFGASPPGFYLVPFLSGLPLWVWSTLPGALRTGLRRRSLSLPLFCAGVYLLALTATAHKEERFLYPGLVLLIVAAAPSLSGLVLSREGRPWRMGVGALALVTTLGAGAFYPPGDLRGDQFRAIVQASRGDAHGLLIVNEGLWGAGGFFYLGRNIPWLTCDWPQDGNFQAAMRDGRFNRAVTFEGRALDELRRAGFRVVGRVGRETLLARP